MINYVIYNCCFEFFQEIVLFKKFLEKPNILLGFSFCFRLKYFLVSYMFLWYNRGMIYLIKMKKKEKENG